MTIAQPTDAASSRTGGDARRRDWRLLPPLGMGLVLGYLVLVPLALMILSSFRPGGFPLDPGFTLANYRAAYGDPGFPSLLWSTLIFAIGSTILALVLGTGLAWLVERSDMPWRATVRALVLLPMATPPILLAIAWAMLLSPRTGFLNQLLQGALGLGSAPFDVFTMPGLIFVQGLALVPTAYLFLAPAFRNMDPSFEEAAITSGAGTALVIRRILLPVLWPPILAAAIFLLIVSFVVFDIPGTLGTPAHISVLSTRIYNLVVESPGGIPLYGRVSALAMVFLAILLVLAGVYHRLTRHAQRYRTVTGKGFRSRVFALGRRGRRAALAAVIVYFLLSVVAPLVILLWTSLMPYRIGISAAGLSLMTLDNHRDFLTNPRVVAATRHSLVIAIVAATAVAILAFLVAWLTTRCRAPGGKILDTLAFLPVAIPGVMIGVALVYVYLTLGAVIPIYGSIWIIAIAYVTQYLPFGSRTTQGVMLQLHPELEEAALASGADTWRVLRRITLPLVWPALAAVWIWVAAHSLRELSSALMLQGRDNAVIPTLIWDYWSGGEPTHMAAGGIWLTAALIVFLLLWRLLARRTALEREA
ncbi:MAG: binding-protein-dependent transport system inner rane protein [Rhodospirillales bacterium]|nr:binding-protein-dependent transport system inner rane protein [Rhodospirillales bacterium]